MNGIQSYGSLNLMNTLFAAQNQMNNLRLSQALTGKSSALDGVSAAYGTKKQSASALSSDDLDFLEQYDEQLKGLKAAAEDVLSGKGPDRLAAGSSDSGVAEASGKLAQASDGYTLTVEQVASGQVNRSEGLRSSEPLPTMGGALRLKTDRGNFEFYLSAAGAKNNKEMLEGFASRINAGQAGVTASVEEKDGVSVLQLTGTPGAGSTFEVSGSLADRLGLTEPAKQGQDAVYTVQKNGGEAERFTSKSNAVTVDGRLSVTLKKAGTAEIQAGGDKAADLAGRMSELVDRYNETLSFLDKNSDRGIGVLYQMKRMIQPPTSERSMGLAGITVRSDGSLRMDRDAFISKLKESPSLMEDITENIARGIRTDAQQGLQERPANLIGGSLLTQRQNDAMQSPINLMSMYNRSGVYNMMNYYAVGALMNLNI